MIHLYERQCKLKKVKYLIGAKTGVKVIRSSSNQLFSSTNAFTRLRSNPTNTFSPIKCLLFWRHYNSTNIIIPHHLAIIRRNSTLDIVSLHFWSKILEISSYKVYFQLRCRSPAHKLIKKENNSQLFFKAFDYKCRI